MKKITLIIVSFLSIISCTKTSEVVPEQNAKLSAYKLNVAFNSVISKNGLPKMAAKSVSGRILEANEWIESYKDEVQSVSETPKSFIDSVTNIILNSKIETTNSSGRISMEDLILESGLSDTVSRYINIINDSLTTSQSKYTQNGDSIEIDKLALFLNITLTNIEKNVNQDKSLSIKSKNEILISILTQKSGMKLMLTEFAKAGGYSVKNGRVEWNFLCWFGQFMCQTKYVLTYTFVRSAQGAGGGAIIGTLFPGIGTVVGAVAGGAIGAGIGFIEGIIRVHVETKLVTECKCK